MAALLLSSPVPVFTNAFLLDGGGRRVLIDTGAGTLMDPLLGHMAASVKAFAPCATIASPGQ